MVALFVRDYDGDEDSERVGVGVNVNEIEQHHIKVGEFKGLAVCIHDTTDFMHREIKKGMFFFTYIDRKYKDKHFILVWPNKEDVVWSGITEHDISVWNYFEMMPLVNNVIILAGEM